MSDEISKDPTPDVTLEEVKESLRRTQQDSDRLSAIIKNLALFIEDTDQDRSDMRPALDQFNQLLHYCNQLLMKIRIVKNKMEQGEN